MKNNPNTKYVLIGLVVLIWGLIIYKVIVGLSAEEPIVPVVYIKRPAKISADSTYQLLNTVYPDPFANENVFEDVLEDTVFPLSTSDPQEPTLQTFASPPVVAQPPPIKYNGYIYNPSTKKKTALITYNGRSMVVSVADMLDEKTKVLKIDNQELVVTVKGERFVIGVGG